MTFNSEDDVVATRHVLEMRKFSDSFIVPNDVLVSVDDPDAFVKDAIRIRVEKMIACDHIAGEEQVVYFDWTYPETTWQTFKHLHAEAWWMRWLVRRRPVKYKTTIQSKVVLVSRYLAYPEAVIQSSRLGRPFIYEHVTQLEL